MGVLTGFAFTLIFSFGCLFFGWAADVYSRRLIICCGTAAWAVSCMACGFARSFGWLFLARMGVGIGEATLTPAAYSLLSDIFPRDRLATAMGVFSFGAIAGIALSLGLGGYTLGVFAHSSGLQTPMGHLMSWQVAFVLAGIPGLVWGLSAMTLPDIPRRYQASAPRSATRPVVALFAANPSLMIAQFAGFSMNALMSYALLAWAPAFMGRSYGWHPAEIAPAATSNSSIRGRVKLLQLTTAG